MAKKGATLCPFAPSLVSCKSAEVLWKESRERDSNSLPLLRQFSRDRFYSNLQERGDCQNTGNTHKATRIVGWVVGWKNGPDLLSSYCESRPIESDLKLVRRPYCGVIHVSAWRRCLSQKCADKKMRVCGGYRKMTARIPVHSNRWLIPDVTPRIALSGNQ